MGPSRNMLCYGAGGAGKSTLAAELAEWVWKKHKKKTRVVNADGGGTRGAFDHLIQAGIAEVWDIDLWTEGSLFRLFDDATKGWWPQDFSIPNSPLLPPVEEWRKCPECGQRCGASGLAMVQKCGSCGVQYAAGTLLPVQRTLLNHIDEVGLQVFEGLTSFGEQLLRRLKTVDSGGGNSIKENGFVVAAPGMQHYGAAQSYIAQYVANVRQLPVDLVYWTALELRSDDDGKPLYGPALPGKKLTSLCIPWFTDVLHLDALTSKGPAGLMKNADGTEVLQRKLFLQSHYPPDNPMFKFAAKTSIPGMPTMIDANMHTFMEESNRAFTQRMEALGL